MKRNRHTRHTYSHARQQSWHPRNRWQEKQVVGIGGKDKLQKEELISLANMLIDELESKTLSLADLPHRAKVLISEWPEPEYVQ